MTMPPERKAGRRTVMPPRGPNWTPPRPATLILWMTAAMFLVVLFFRALATLFDAA